jgi:acetyl esterase/lipase
VLLALVSLCPPDVAAKVLPDLPYKSGTLTDYERERCKLDLYLPSGAGFPTLVWFHGGGLKSGDADLPFTAQIAQALADDGIGFAVVRYRYSPRVKFPAYVEDAAASFAWTVRHIAAHGGDARRVFMGGHSAGGYLAAIVGLDGRYLQAHGLTLAAVAGLIPVSGQMLTHYTIREERGLQKFNVSADEAAPIFHCRPDTPPLLVLYADKDMATRQEENVYFVSTMKAAGNKRVHGVLVADRDHGTIARNLANRDDPARQAVIKFINAASSSRRAP